MPTTNTRARRANANVLDGWAIVRLNSRGERPNERITEITLRRLSDGYEVRLTAPFMSFDDHARSALEVTE